MPDFTVGGRKGNTRANPPFDFEKIPLLGNAGRKINDVVYDRILSPYVVPKSEGSNAPGANIKPGILLALRNPRSLLEKIFLNLNEANPSAAELLRNQLPSGEILSDAELARRLGQQPEPQILPMWAADP